MPALVGAEAGTALVMGVEGAEEEPLLLLLLLGDGEDVDGLYGDGEKLAGDGDCPATPPRRACMTQHSYSVTEYGASQTMQAVVWRCHCQSAHCCRTTKKSAGVTSARCVGVRPLIHVSI